MDTHMIRGEVVSALVVPPGSRVLLVVNSAGADDDSLRALRLELEQQFASEVTILVGDVRAVSVEEPHQGAPVCGAMGKYGFGPCVSPPHDGPWHEDAQGRRYDTPANGGEDWPAGRQPWPPPAPRSPYEPEPYPQRTTDPYAGEAGIDNPAWPPPYGLPREHQREEYETRPPAREPVEEADDLPPEPDDVRDQVDPLPRRQPGEQLPVVLDDADDEGPVGP
jgi:hypothetical protein